MSGPWRLTLVRVLRSVGQGAMIVDFALYARALGWSAVYLGIVLGAAMLANAGFTALFGPLSDRFGCRRFLLAYEAMMVWVGLAAFLSGTRWVVTVVAILGGFGRGSTGIAGPFGPVEQTWLASLVPSRDWGRMLSWNSAAGAFGTASGAALAALPALWTGMQHPVPADYRPLFLIISAMAVLSIPVLASVPDRRRPREKTRAKELKSMSSDRDEQRQERGLLLRLAGLNVLNGMGNGLVGPLIAYWFAVRFDRGPGQIGPILALALALAGFSALGAGSINRRIGAVRTVVWMRGISLLLLFALPFAPTFLLAAGMYMVRSGLNRGTVGSRQALTFGLVRGRRRGLAASINSVSMQIPRVVGPAIAGFFFAAGLLSVPFVLAGLFQGAYVVLYPRLFGRYDPTFASPERTV